MFCYQCGKELRPNARFCFYCGTPVKENTDSAPASPVPEPPAENPAACSEETNSQTINSGIDAHEISSRAADSDADTRKALSQAAASDVNAGETHSQAVTSGADSAETALQAENAAPALKKTDTHSLSPETDLEETAGQVLPESAAASASETPADLILKRGKVIATGRELHLNGKHYIRKPGRKKFKKVKGASAIPFGTILGTSTEHHKYGGRILLSLLLLAGFTAGALVSARYGYDTYNELNAPYRDSELAEQERIMAVIDGDGAGQLLQFQNAQKENRANAEALSAELTGLRAQQTEEILDAVYNSDKFDLDAFFNREPFARAYQEYLQELLDVFKADVALDSWLYSYYETTRNYGGNYFLDTDMWIYNGSGENKFSSDLDSAAILMSERYDPDLYEHILLTGRIYITGADFLQKILSLPRYTADGAVFANAYGGVPDPAEMSVPGWSRAHYEEFWLYGVDYYNVDTPMWLDYGLSADNFALDWNALVDETAYYAAYRNFMDKIDPNLPCYDIAVYHADDTAYGGMGYSIKGAEASFRDMVTSYAENHPEFIDELMESNSYGTALTTSVDEEIADTEARLEKLESELPDLQEQEKELSQLLADADMHRTTYALLLADIERHTQELTCRLLFSGGAVLLSLLATLICLCRFFDFMKRPRHLFIISGRDMEYAFSTRRYSGEQLAALQNRLPRQGDNGSDPLS